MMLPPPAPPTLALRGDHAVELGVERLVAILRRAAALRAASVDVGPLGRGWAGVARARPRFRGTTVSVDDDRARHFTTWGAVVRAAIENSATLVEAVALADDAEAAVRQHAADRDVDNLRLLAARLAFAHERGVRKPGHGRSRK